MMEPLGGVSAPREPLPDDVSKGDDDTSIRDSFGMTVKGIAGTTASSIVCRACPRIAGISLFRCLMHSPTTLLWRVRGASLALNSLLRTAILEASTRC